MSKFYVCYMCPYVWTCISQNSRKKGVVSSKAYSKHPVCVPEQPIENIKPIIKHNNSSHKDSVEEEHHQHLFCVQYWEFIRNHFQIDCTLFYCRKLQQNKHPHRSICADLVQIIFLLELNIVIS